ncbi:MAG: o-succinylbenzoate synthase [Flavobacteriales bacterium]|nr:MAG: o-succinylbenzoate synthase [Flavobacteriales bacterium]
MKAKIQPYELIFKKPSGTSRGILKTKQTFILEIEKGNQKGIGECGLFRGLSYDDVPEYETKLEWLCENIHLDRTEIQRELLHFPSIWFGYEQAMLNLEQNKNIYFPSEFTQNQKSIQINGLIWMGDIDFMKEQIEEKLKLGFRCIKLKIGVNWKEEKAILEALRKDYPVNQLELRVDANGAFGFEKAKIVLQELADVDIHSIEQPIKAGQIDLMRKLCAKTPTPIALDEELIGVVEYEQKAKLLNEINPQYIILKPSLVGGFSGSDEWIALAEERNIGWWITSALESNIGLNAIAQYTFTKQSPMPQGLGTGGLFTNNFPSPLYLEGEELWFKY